MVTSDSVTLSYSISRFVLQIALKIPEYPPSSELSMTLILTFGKLSIGTSLGSPTPSTRSYYK